MDDLTKQLVDLGAGMPVEARKTYVATLRAAADGVEALGDAAPVTPPEAPAADAPPADAEKAVEGDAPTASEAAPTAKAAGPVQWSLDLAKAVTQADVKKAAGPAKRTDGGPSWPMDMGA